MKFKTLKKQEAAQMEKEIFNYWEKNNIFQKSIDQRR